MDDLDLDAKRKRIELVVKWGIGLIGAVVIAPYVFLAVEGIAGLFLAAVIGTACINLAPVFGVWIANKRMQLLVAAVESNPIATMQNLFAEKTTELLAADNNIADFETEIRNFDDQTETFKAQYPNEAQTYESLSDKMHDALSEMKAEQTSARKALKDFDQKITKAKAIYKMSLAAQRVTQLSKSAEAQVFAKIREDVAFDTVRTQLNKSFSSLNLALERRKDAQATLPAATQAMLPPEAPQNTRIKRGVG